MEREGKIFKQQMSISYRNSAAKVLGSLQLWPFLCRFMRRPVALSRLKKCDVWVSCTLKLDTLKPDFKRQGFNFMPQKIKPWIKIDPII